MTITSPVTMRVVDAPTCTEDVIAGVYLGKDNLTEPKHYQAGLNLVLLD